MTVGAGWRQSLALGKRIARIVAKLPRASAPIAVSR